jgi:hypothetical protein
LSVIEIVVMLRCPPAVSSLVAEAGMSLPLKVITSVPSTAPRVS